MPTVCLMCPTTVVLQINHWAFHVPYIELKVCTCTLKAEFARLLNLMRNHCTESASTCIRKISRQQPPSCQICAVFWLPVNAHKYQWMISAQGTYFYRTMTVPSGVLPRLPAQTILQHESLHSTPLNDLILRHDRVTASCEPRLAPFSTRRKPLATSDESFPRISNG